MAETLIYEQQDAVAIISMNRPDALNGFTTELREELLHAFETAQRDEAIRVIVFTGEGRAFSAGADLKTGFEGDRTTQEQLLFEYAPVLIEISQIPKPVIAAVPGFAAGIGMSFALHSDLLVMAEGLCIESERISAERCLELGIANKVVPADQLRDTTITWAKELSTRAPLSIAATKKVMRHAMDNDWFSCYTMEAEEQRKLQASDDAKEGISAFFEKRAPNFTGK